MALGGWVRTRQRGFVKRRTQITQKDWDVIHMALDMLAAGEWDEGSYGERPDLETVIAKVSERRKPTTTNEGD